MANIQPDIDKIAEAIYGEEVRRSIVHALTNMNIQAAAAQVWATGSDVNPDDPSYISPSAENSAKGYAEAAGVAQEAAEDAQEAAEAAQGAAETAETNAETSATAAASSETAASASASAAALSEASANADALKAEGVSVGTQNGTPVTSGPYYHNNAAYWSAKAMETAQNVTAEAIGNWLDDHPSALADAVVQEKLSKYAAVSDMSADTNIQTGQIVATIGYTARGDGGGSMYYISDTEVSGEYNILLNSGKYAVMLPPKDAVTPEMFGAVGDGLVDDTLAMQICFDFAAKNHCSNSLRGTTYKCFGLILPAGSILNGNNATLVKPDLSAAPYNMSVADMKWIRMLKVSHHGANDSDLTIIKDLNINSNCWEMWDVSDGYAQEQASSLICFGDNNAGGRLRVYIENCTFADCPSDGIHIVNDVEAFIVNCKSTDCFRGGLTITGGNTDVTVNGFECNSPTVNDGIDIEIDSPGYNKSFAINVSLTNIVVDKDFDIIIPKNSRAVINNLVMRGKEYFIANSGDLYIRNSVLNRGSSTSGDTINVISPRQNRMVFENVVFDGGETTEGAAEMTFANSSTDALIPINVFFVNCRFKNAAWGIGGGRKTSTNNVSYLVVADGCIFDTTNGIGGKDGNIEYGVKQTIIRNCIFNNCEVAVRGVQSTSYPMTIEFENNKLRNVGQLLYVGAARVIVQGYYDSGVLVQIAPGQNPTFYGKRTTFVSAMPEVAGLRGSMVEDYATDGSTVWKYSGSGTVWNVIA